MRNLCASALPESNRRKDDTVSEVSDGQKVIPNPGSPEAVEQGCKCAVYDNNHGTGFQWGGESTPCFWINQECPLHGEKEAES
jgi:hypothetical protein